MMDEGGERERKKRRRHGRPVLVIAKRQFSMRIFQNKSPVGSLLSASLTLPCPPCRLQFSRGLPFTVPFLPHKIWMSNAIHSHPFTCYSFSKHRMFILNLDLSLLSFKFDLGRSKSIQNKSFILPPTKIYLYFLFFFLFLIEVNSTSV